MPPKKIDHVPDWLLLPQEQLEQGEAIDKMIAEDLISIQYWALHREALIKLAAATAKKHAHWKQGFSIFEQPEDVREAYRAVLDNPALIDDEVIERRLMASAIDMAYNKATYLEEAFARVKLRLVLMLQDQNLLPNLEQASVKEYLQGKYPNENPWTNSTIPFFVDTLIPIAESNGISRDLILGSAMNFRKASEANRYLRTILDEQIAWIQRIQSEVDASQDPEEKAQLEASLQEHLALDDRTGNILKSLFQEMSLTSDQGGMTIEQFTERMKKLSKPDQVPYDPAMAYLYNTRKGGFLIISTDDGRVLQAIKSKLRQLIDLHLGEPEDIVNEIMRITNVPTSKVP